MKETGKRRDRMPPLPADAARWRHFVRRILISDPPRGLGAALATAFLLASAGYGVSKGGHAPEIITQMQDLGDTAANRAGFQISSVALSGEKQVGRDEILKFAGVSGHSSLFFLDAAAARERLKTNPWIADATVLKLYPGRLQIEIKEREAFALWQKDGRVSVISADGAVLEPFIAPRFAELPLVVGAGAEIEAKDFVALLARYPVIAGQVEASVLVAQRRWNLHLKNGIEVRLPEAEPERALQTLVELDRDKKLLSRDILVVDLRLADRVTVRLSDSAAAEREQAAKEAAAKAKKVKGKGSDA
jgi:cell division protein FtsQ